MRLCILDSVTKKVINVSLSDTLDINLPEGQELAPQHDGQIGWVWTESGWYNPNRVIVTYDILIRNARIKRNNLLRQSVDTFNPIWWESLSNESKILWQNYRQELLDVPQQQEFPLNIIWPEKPGE